MTKRISSRLTVSSDFKNKSVGAQPLTKLERVDAQLLYHLRCARRLRREVQRLRTVHKCDAEMVVSSPSEQSVIQETLELDSPSPVKKPEVFYMYNDSEHSDHQVRSLELPEMTHSPVQRPVSDTSNSSSDESQTEQTKADAFPLRTLSGVYRHMENFSKAYIERNVVPRAQSFGGARTSVSGYSSSVGEIYSSLVGRIFN